MAGERSSAGYTLVEVVIASVIGVAILAKISLVMSQVRDVQRSEGNAMEVETQARRVVDRIAYAVMGANQETLLPLLDPDVHTTELRYRLSLGIEDGEVVWSDPERIDLTDDGRGVRWSQNPDTADERHVLWTNIVRPVLEGELANGDDDNLNGLDDEEGLHFLVDGTKVKIRLSLETLDIEGNPYIHTAETTVTCRNRVGGAP